MNTVLATLPTPGNLRAFRLSFHLRFMRALGWALVIIGLWPAAAQAQNTWLGTAGTTGNWNDPTKWSSGTVPDGSTAIAIPTGTVLDNFNINNNQDSFQLTVAAPASLNILSTTTLNAPVVQVGNSGAFANAGVVDSGIFENHSGGVLNNSGGMTNFALSNDAGATVNNSGTLLEPQKALVNQGVFNNSGGFVAAGLVNYGSTNNTGEIVFKENAPGFASVVENAGMLTNQAKGTITNTGSFQNDIGAILTNAGAITDTGGIVNSGTFNNSGTYTAANGFINLGTTNNTGQIVVSASSLVEDFGTLTNSKGAQITNNGDFDTAKGLILTNAGTLTNNSTLTNGSFFTNSGVLNNTGSLQNLISLQVASGGVVNNTLSGAISTTGLAGGALFAVLQGGTLNNTGSFTVDALSNFTMAAGSTVVNNATGQMTLSSSTLQVVVGGSLKNNGMINLAGSIDNTGFFLPPPTLVVASTGTLSGTGFITGAVSNFGTIRPGDLTGALTIFGLDQEMTGSTLDIFLDGMNPGEFGQLDVNGDVVLGGTLDVALGAGFDPVSGEIFEIVSGKTSGAFADVILPTLPAGLSFQLDQEANGVFLDVTGTATGGGNGGGSGGGNGGGGTTIPEPSEWLMLAAGLCSLLAFKEFARPRPAGPSEGL